jgi:hypothetical protein
MARNDFLLNEDGDLDIQNGDLVTGDANQQHISHILTATKGTYKQTPLLGVGISLELNGELDIRLKRLITLQLEVDNYKILKVGASNNVIDINYEDNNG